MTTTITVFHGRPVIVRHGFVHIEIFAAVHKQRSKSAPPRLESTLAHPPEKKRKVKHDDDDLALQEARVMVLSDTWTSISNKALQKERKRVTEEWEPKRMKLRFSMKRDGFIQVAKIMNFTNMDLSTMRELGIVREESPNIVNVYLSDMHMHDPFLQKFVKEGANINKLSEAHFFLCKTGTDVGLVIRYEPNMKLIEVKRSASAFYKIKDLAKIQVRRLNYEHLNGKTLGKCQVSPGDCIRITV